MAVRKRQCLSYVKHEYANNVSNFESRMFSVKPYIQGWDVENMRLQCSSVACDRPCTSWSEAYISL